MHPALSVIFFTTASGVGYGLALALGLSASATGLPAHASFILSSLAISYALVTAGLLSSTFHLGHPERAWRAISQWRTSWLSREGVAAIISFAPAALFGLAWILVSDDKKWVVYVFGLLMAAMAVITVFCTAMIYASLATIHQWHNAWVVPNYLLLSLYPGAVLLYLLMRAWGDQAPVQLWGALITGVAALVVKLGYWRFIDTTHSLSTAESATGLGHLGKVRLLDAPHTESNYLMKEMGFRIARKHSAKLRLIAVTLTFIIPIALLVIASQIVHAGGVIPALLAGVGAFSGVFVERWLFFAEAKHTVTLYYGAAVS